MPRPLSEDTKIQVIMAAIENPDYTLGKIAAATSVSVSSVSRILKDNKEMIQDEIERNKNSDVTTKPVDQSNDDAAATLNIIKMYSNNDYTVNDISRETGVSIEDIQSIASEYGLPMKSVVRKILPNNNSTVVAGLVKGRHDLPVDDYIFDLENGSLPEELMFNYGKQEDVCHDFIRKHIQYTKNEKTGLMLPDKDMTVYITGLSCCIASIIKACNDSRINLRLKHFDNNNIGTYHTQIIWDKFQTNQSFTPFDKALNQGYDILLYDLKESDVKEGKNYYILKAPLFVNKNIMNNERASLKIFADYQSCMAEYSERVAACRESKKDYALFVLRASIKDGKLYFQKDTIAKSFSK